MTRHLERYGAASGFAGTPLDRETLEFDLEGPRIAELPVVGAAIFAYTAEMRAALVATGAK